MQMSSETIRRRASASENTRFIPYPAPHCESRTVSPMHTSEMSDNETAVGDNANVEVNETDEEEEEVAFWGGEIPSSPRAAANESEEDWEDEFEESTDESTDEAEEEEEDDDDDVMELIGHR